MTTPELPEITQFINGTFRPGQGQDEITLIDPASDATLAQYSSANQADLDAALEASAAGFAAWSKQTAKQRQAVLNAAADLIEADLDRIATCLTLESGKPIGEAKMEVNAALGVLRFYAEEGKRIYGRLVPPTTPGLVQKVLSQPIGPVIAFTAWNFPAINFMRKVGAALAAGCSITIKPSEETPMTGLLLAKAFDQAGLPAGALNIVYGDPAMISQHLCASSIPRKLTFTGSVPVGRELIKLASQNLLRTTMELGGHAPFIVFEDADIDKAAKLMIAGKFRNAGQVCVSPTRFYVHTSVHDQFVERAIAAAQSLKVGPGIDPDNSMGPLINVRRVAAMHAILDDAISNGARIAYQAEIPNGPGSYFAPTLLTDVSEDAQIMNEEPFGPIAPVSRFSDVGEVIARANGLPYGLAAYAFTKSAAISARLSDEIQAGMLAINSLQIATPETPFGGIGWSGWGSEGGQEGLEPYLITRLVTETH